MISQKSLCILLIFTFSAIACIGQSNGNIDVAISSFLDSLGHDEFSGSVLVAHKDRVMERRAYGHASIEYDVENTMETRFNIASITKLFTTVATLQLYEQGKVDLHVSIGKYLPEYPNKTVRDSVTVHQLLTHTSGLNNFYVTDWDRIKNTDYHQVSDFVQVFASDTLLSSPGTKYDYSATGFVLLGLIIEEVSGESYYDYVRDNIFIPSGMINTTELEVDSVVSNIASGYTSMFGEFETPRKNDYYLTKASPGGFYYSTADDLFRFSKALRDHTLLTKETTDLMLEPKVKGYNTHMGYGIGVDQRYNQVILGHSGGWYGIHCELMDFIHDRYTVVILSNMDDGGADGASMVSEFFMKLLAEKK